MVSIQLHIIVDKFTFDVIQEYCAFSEKPIKDGDVLVFLEEKVVGIAMNPWICSITEKCGDLDQVITYPSKADWNTMTFDDGRTYARSYELAKEQASRRNWRLR